jgi:UDP-glucose 4-epimerase
VIVRTALVTGAAGFIGSHLAERLVESNYRVVAVDRLLWGEQRIEHLLQGHRVLLKRGDIRDEALMAGVASLGPFDTVYHLAALHYIPYCSAHPVETLSVNVLGTLVLLEALKAAPPGQVVFASSGDVYAPKNAPHHEADQLEPLSIYGISKVFGENLIAAAASQMPATRFVVARLFNAYGPRETNPHVIPSIIAQLKHGNHVRLGNTWPRRDYVHVRDIAEALVALGTCGENGGPQYFNVGTGVACSVQDVIEALQRILQLQVVVEVGDELVRPVERPHLQASVAKLKEATGWQPRNDLGAGLRELCIQEGLLERRA